MIMKNCLFFIIVCGSLLSSFADAMLNNNGQNVNVSSVNSLVLSVQNPKQSQEMVQKKKFFSDMIPLFKDSSNDVWRIIIGYCGLEIPFNLWAVSLEAKHTSKLTKELNRPDFSRPFDKAEWYHIREGGGVFLSSPLHRSKYLSLSTFSFNGKKRFVMSPCGATAQMREKKLEQEEILHDFNGNNFSMIKDVAFSADNGTFVTVHGKNPIKIWDAGSGKLFGLLDQSKDLQCVTFNTDNTALCTVDFDKHICQVWEPAIKIDKITIDQTILLWLFDKYKHENAALALQSMVQVEGFDIQQLYTILNAFSPVIAQRIKNLTAGSNAPKLSYAKGSSSSSSSSNSSSLSFLSSNVGTK